MKASRLDIIHPDMPDDIMDDIINFFRKGSNGEDKEAYKDVSDFMIRDVFKQYYNRTEDIHYEMDESQHWWHEVLTLMNNYLLKVITEERFMNSFVAAKHAIKALRNEIKKEKEKDESGGGGVPGDGKDNRNAPNSGPGGNTGQDFKEGLQEGLNQAARDTMAEIKERENIDEQFGMGDGGNSAGKGPSEVPEDIQDLRDRLAMFEDVILNKNEVSKFVKKSVASVKAGIGGKPMYVEDSLLDADEISDLLNEEYLVDLALIPDITVLETRYSLKYDLYVDVSGSMNSSCKLSNDKSVNRLNLAAILAVKMEQMGLLADFYKFNTKIMPLKDKKRILNMSVSGGTNIEMCVQAAKKKGRPSVILTDGCDQIDTYSDMVYVIALDVGYISPHGAWSLYHNRGQSVVFQNGKFVSGKKLMQELNREE